jgi:hypothetical protein
MIIDNELWYKSVPKLTETIFEGKVTILWNQQVQTDGTVTKNKSDIIIRDNEKGTCAAFSANRNVIEKEAEKILKFWVMTNLMHSFSMYLFFIFLFYATTCFEQQVLIIRRSKLY